ncbi:MAG: glycosyltransferase family 4 protein [Gammaproteobacteria bacterium]
MKIALCSSFVPFVLGGARNIVEWLEVKLLEAGHEIERVYLPHVDDPNLLVEQMSAYRWIDLASSADRIICFRPPAHFIPHPHKILWFIHHIRVFYDLWDSPYAAHLHTPKYEGVRNMLHSVDTAAMHEAKRIFTISDVVTKRLKKFNNVDSEVLLYPVLEPERFHCRSFNDEIVCISRLEHHKRQHLLIEALQHTTTPVKLRFCGAASDVQYLNTLTKLIKQFNLQHRVFLENRWITENEKIDYLANCLAAAYLPHDEDGYGYSSLEACHSGKPLLTVSDSGGVLELIQNGINGFVTPPEPKAIAAAMDNLYRNKAMARKMGQNAVERIDELNINWHSVIERLLS